MHGQPISSLERKFMNWKAVSLSFTVLSILCVSSPCVSSEAPLDNKTLELISKSVYEVIVPKPTEDSLSYKDPLPFNQLPYSVRNDKYYSVGTAFAIGPNEFISAAHVMNIGVESQFNEPCLRDKDGNIYNIDKIVKYSDHRDFVVFSLKNRIADHFLRISKTPRLNQKVFAVGNALGEGIVIRDGLYTSNTPEDENGEWSWFRFSAAASPGNSGGPLLDENGDVIGIVLLKSPNENLNFALPIGEVIKADNVADSHQKLKYTIDIMVRYRIGAYKKTLSLPKSYKELSRNLIDIADQNIFYLMKDFFTDERNNIFPNGNGSNMLLNSSYSAFVPRLIMRKDDGNWDAIAPSETKSVDLGNNGFFTYGNLGSSSFLYIQKPDDISLEKFYSDSKLFMDLILKGIFISRQVGSEKIRITSLGKSHASYNFTDYYGRKWFVNVWSLEFSDEKLVAFSLPVPGGLISMMRLGKTAAIDRGHISDLKILANFVYVSYYGTLKKWKEFFIMKDMLPTEFSSINLLFDYKKSFSYKSKRLSFFFPQDVMEISDKSYMTLYFNYFKENNKTVWDAGDILIGEDTGNSTSIGIGRNLRPSPELSDNFQNAWTMIMERKFPYNDSPYFKDGLTAIRTIKPVQDSDLLYTLQYTKDGKIDDREMTGKLRKISANLIIHEGGSNAKTEISNVDESAENVAYWKYARAFNPVPITAQEHLFLGFEKKERGEIDGSISEYTKAIKLNPEFALAYFERGAAYYSINKLDMALSDFRRAIEVDPKYPNAYYGRGCVYRIKNDYDKAVIDFNKAIELNNKYENAYLNRGNIYYDTKQYDLALRDFSTAIEINPKSKDCYFNRGNIYKLSGDYELAISDYNRAIELSPKFDMAYLYRGAAYLANKDRERAMTDYNKAIELNPNYAEAYLNRGDIFRVGNEWEKALSDYSKAIELNFANAKAYYNRATVYYAKKDFDKAVEDFTNALKIENSSDSYNSRSMAYEAQGKIDQALADIVKVLEINSEYANAYTRRGIIYARIGKYDLAIQDFDRALKIEPENDGYYNNRGFTFHIKGEMDKAIADFNRAIEINPKNALAFINRGNAFAVSGQKSEACSNWKQACDQGSCQRSMKAKEKGYCE